MIRVDRLTRNTSKVVAQARDTSTVTQGRESVTFDIPVGHGTDRRGHNIQVTLDRFMVEKAMACLSIKAAK